MACGMPRGGRRSAATSARVHGPCRGIQAPYRCLQTLASCRNCGGAGSLHRLGGPLSLRKAAAPWKLPLALAPQLFVPTGGR